MLSALDVHAGQLNAGSLSPSSRRHFLAEAIHSLTPHFSGKLAETAQRMLIRLSEQLQIQLPTATFADAVSHRRVIFGLLKDAGNIHPNQHPSVRHQNVTAIDLHNLSHALGAAFCETALQYLLKDGVSPIDIVHGKSSHKSSNEGKMRARVESVLARSEFGNVSKDFREGYVRVTRAASSADQGNAARKMGLNPTARPFIPGGR